MILVSGGLPAIAEDAPMVLELVLNGNATGRVGEFVSRDNALSASPTELSELGFKVPDALRHGEELVRLDKLPGVKAVLDMAGQRVLVTAPDQALRPTLLGPQNPMRAVPVSPTGIGAVVNYDMLATAAGASRPSGGASLDGRFFSPLGVVTATGLASLEGSSTAPFRRLDTAYEYDEPDEALIWRAGDAVTGALSWTRPVRLMGGQVASDFTLRPDLVTTAMPNLSASAAVPSTVDVLVDGVRQFSQAVQPGPFQIRSLPTVNGAGEVAVAVQDELGRQTLVTLPFYASPQLLATDLASYSVELGSVRQSYGGPDDGYRNAAAIASLRYGLLDWMTPEAHGEFGADLRNAGLGGVIRAGTLGVISLAGAASLANTMAALPTRGQTSGSLGSVGVSRQAGTFSVSVSGAAASSGFRDTAAMNGSPHPRVLLNASISRSFGIWGGVSLGYVNQQGGARYLGGSPGSASLGTTSLNSASRVAIVTTSYTVRLTDRWGLYANAFRDLSGSGFGILFGFTFRPFDRVSGSAGLSTDQTGRPSAIVQAARPAIAPGDWGLSIADQEGSSISRRADAEYLGTWGRASAGAAQSGGSSAGQAGMRGALVFTDGTVMASDKVNDSFAVVRTGDVPDLPVTFENRPVGSTDSNGRLLVPYLNGYQANTLAVDANRVPPDVQLDSTSQLVRPRRNAGVVVDFGARRTSGAVVRLELAPNKPVPLGASALLPGGEPIPVGFDGEVYATGLGAKNTLDVTLPDGSHCLAAFGYHAIPGDLPTIGPVP